jgi:hypothetical protein
MVHILPGCSMEAVHIVRMARMLIKPMPNKVRIRWILKFGGINKYFKYFKYLEYLKLKEKKC